ncbi:hypothetical protein HWV23_05520 [Natronomonas halophila]|uniref:hypothetical protein n=1 Tax=Natronomonas halophila TaxID=2747817 RepID=UPI0015B570FA|nr:hypothetical protein [Natronomonas halophila]QLD85203.1 hypothetical protein HWV23_05520 [Natronomonas halophila]
MYVFLAFRDANGSHGTISADLSVNYDGEWEAAIEQVVSEVAAAHSDAGDIETAAAFTELVVDLPEHTPVQSIERREE